MYCCVRKVGLCLSSSVTERCPLFRVSINAGSTAYNFALYLNFSVLDLCYVMAERSSEPVVSKERVSSLCILFLQLSLFS